LDRLAQWLQVHTKVNGEHLNEASMLSWLAFHKMAMDATVAPNNPTQPDTFIWWWMLPGATKKRLTDLPASAHLPIRQKYLDLYCRAASAPVRARTAKSRRLKVKPGPGRSLKYFHGWRPFDLIWNDIEYGPAEEWDAKRPASENRPLKMVTTVRIAQHPVNADRSGDSYVSPEFLRQWSVCLKVSPKNERASKAFMLSWLAYHKMTIDYFRAKAKVNSARESVVDPATLTWWWMLETNGYLRANRRQGPGKRPFGPSSVASCLQCR
jgi:hypothetical protein